MSTNPNPDLEHDPDLDLASDNGELGTPANDNGGAITPAPEANALASAALTALIKAFKTVDTTPIGGRPVRPLMQFKSREGGIWAFGQRRTIPEADSQWAVNPASFQWGYVCWNDSSKIVGERLVSVSESMPDVTKLPDTGFPWQEQMAVSLKCISGVDAGTEVVFKTNTEGGKAELNQLIQAVKDRLNGPHDGKVSPIVRLEVSSYPHQQFGKTWIPVMRIANWMPLDGPAPVPAPEPASPSPTEQPRRRRVS